MSPLFLFLGLPGGSEWLLIFFAVLLLFGGRKIPELMRGIGRGIREFNDARNKVTNELEEEIRDKKDKKELEKSN
jgi:sec-independent protein translocase protein TatA